MPSGFVNGNFGLFGDPSTGTLRSDAIDDLEFESLAKDVDHRLDTISSMLRGGMIEQVGSGVIGACGS